MGKVVSTILMFVVFVAAGVCGAGTGYYGGLFVLWMLGVSDAK